MITTSSYKGDISPAECWKYLSEDKHSYLVDVRTFAEWAFTGIPDLTFCKKVLIKSEWQKFPTMTVNENFINEVASQIPNKDANIFFICRSGARSKASAMEMTNAGFSSCFNVEEGFEGDLNIEGHRNTISGWKFNKLPWRQS